jgi:alkanesulfonate monooxygenase SsuD/methylene tetrahydromethanopterin reductase-like flavin-dependent oxidoreductase (luciferase family)
MPLIVTAFDCGVSSDESTWVTPSGLSKGVVPLPRRGGGASLAAARRAGRYGLGMLGNGAVPGMQAAYQDACRRHGHEPGFFSGPDRDTATACFVAEDVHAAWDEIGKYPLHDSTAYASWNPDHKSSANITTARTVDELRRSPSHVILTPDEAARRVRNGEILNLTPLCGGAASRHRVGYLRRAVEVSLPGISA